MLTPLPVLFMLMGVTSMLLQITVLRLLLATFSGNELDIGITLSFWLIYIGIGSYAGNRLSYRHAFALSFIFIALLALPTVIAIKGIRTFLSLAPGEAVSFTGTLLSTAMILLPLCFFIGIQFPLAVSYAESRNAAGSVYGLESLGAFCSGMLFTFLIASRLGAFELCLILALINLSAAFYLSRRKLIPMLFIIPLFLYFSFHTTAPSLSWHSAKIARAGESKLGEITIVTVGEQSSIYANGQLVFSLPDFQTDEMSIHLPMTLHPSPKDILIIGGSPGILKELLKYRIDRADFIELDPMIIEFAIGLLKSPEDLNAINDPKIHIVIQDGRGFIKGVKNQTYDMIILNLPQPTTASINRFYTVEFFREAQKALRENGILAIHIPKSAGYMGKSMQTASGSVYNALLSVFQHVTVTSQEYGMLFSSETHIDSDPDVLERRFTERGLPVRYFHAFIFRDAFSSFGVDYVRNRLSGTKSVNSDFQPSAYLFNLMLWAEIHGGKAFQRVMQISRWQIFSTTLTILSLMSLFLFRRRTGIIFFSTFTTGFFGISFVLIAILTYQSLYGFVYEMIGALSAIFMAGIWVGTEVAKSVQKPLRYLFILDVLVILLSVVSVFFLGKEMEASLYAIVLVAGVISGSQFSLANLFIGESTVGGRLYALDLLGSFIGALISSLIMIPLFGIACALLLVGMLKAFSSLLTLSLRPFYRN